MKHKDIREAELKGHDHRKLPVGSVISSPVKGDFLALPLFGWVAKRAQTETSLVMLVTLLMRSLEDPSPRGTLQVELPIWDETELATLAALERFGWDGRVWPIDDGWPSGSKEDEDQLTSLMESATLRATFTFHSPTGIAAQSVSIQRAKGPFLMPPLPEPEGEPDQAKLLKLRQLCANPSIFTNPLKPAILDS
jgi:hypothetical protein